MVNFAPHRWAVAAAAGSLLLVISGAVVTSSQASAILLPVHLGIAALVGIFTVILTVALWRTDQRVWRRRLAALLLVLIGLTAADVGKVLHAVVAHVFFAMSLTAAHVTSPRWLEGPKLVQDGGFPSLRSLSLFATALTLLQVALGAAYRHNSMTVTPHIVGAIAVTVVLLIVATFVITQFPNHAVLTRAAWAMIGVATIQIGLGVIAYVGRLSQPEGVDASGGLVASTVAHVVFGAATLAASTDLAVKVFYHVRPRAAFESGLPAVS